MNQNKLIAGISVVVLAALGIWYVSSSNMAGAGTGGETATTSVSTNVTGTPTAATPTNPNTFRSIFAQSGNHQCSYEQVGASSRSSSVIYIADGKMRGEFRTTSGTETSANLMIYNGGILYSWREGASVGKKSSVTSIAEIPEVIPEDLTSGAVFGGSANNVSWDCHVWAKDAKLFLLPTYVKF